jgi:hypothetical protein
MSPSVVLGERALYDAGAVVCPVPPFARDTGFQPEGSCVLASDPEKFVNAGCEQFALPDAATPVEKLLVEHWVGAEAKAVAVEAFPVVL